MKHWRVLLAVAVVSGLMTAGVDAGLCTGSVACGPGEGNPPIDPADIGGATYIEAGHGQDGNTVDADSGSVDWTTATGGSWANRSDLSHDLYVDSTGHEIPGNRLKTTVSVPQGTYEVFGLFETHWDINPPINVSDSRSIQMGLDLNNLSSFSIADGVQVPGEAVQGQATNIVSLGTLTDVNEISVFIAGSIDPERGRSGYRGIAYVPEPAAGLLLAVGATLLMRRRSA